MERVEGRSFHDDIVSKRLVYHHKGCHLGGAVRWFSLAKGKANYSERQHRGCSESNKWDADRLDLYGAHSKLV